MDNICIKKIWQESDLFEFEFKCVSKTIECSSDIYVSNGELDDLYNQLSLFLEKKVTSFWLCGERGNETFPSISFEFIYEDKLGHVKIEIFIELNDGGNLDKHTACFYINTEIGLLYQFREKIKHLKEMAVGEKILLLNEDII